jgi:hypothetical protein
METIELEKNTSGAWKVYSSVVELVPTMHGITPLSQKQQKHLCINILCDYSRFSFTYECMYVLQYCRLNSGSHACQAGALLLELIHQ